MMIASISPDFCSESFKKITGPFEMMLVTTKVERTIKKTEQNARQK
jgi:hypothetical protein